MINPRLHQEISCSCNSLSMFFYFLVELCVDAFSPLPKLLKFGENNRSDDFCTAQTIERVVAVTGRPPKVGNMTLI